MISLALLISSVLALPQLPAEQEPPRPTLRELQQRVVVVEHEALRTQASLAWARALLADAEGKGPVAADERRKVVAYCGDSSRAVLFLASTAIRLLIDLSQLLADVGPDPQTLPELRERVVTLEHKAARTQASLAWARAALAKAEGKDRLAAAEWRKVVVYCEGQYKASWAIADRFCSGEFVERARHELALARVHLAEVERDRETLLDELPRVIASCNKQIQVIQRLRDGKAITVDEARDQQKAYQEEIRWAQSLHDVAKKQLPAAVPAGQKKLP